MLLTSIIMSFFSLTILTAIRYSMRVSKGFNTGEKIFYYLVMGAQILIIFELLSRFSGTSYFLAPIFSRVGNFVLFSMHPVLAILWFLYIHYQIHSSEKILKKIWIYGVLVILINLLFVTLNIRYGYIYQIDISNIYHRGYLFILPEMLNLVILAGTFIMIIYNKKRLSIDHIRTYTIVLIIPLIGLVLQILFQQYPVAVHSVALALSVKFVNLQHKKINHDYLTGLFNRRQLDYYIEDRIKYASKNNEQFSVILVDIDDFKQINDNYGHHIGDEALKTTANIIRNSINSEDFAARFGGDEFYIISEASTEEEITQLINRIAYGFEKYNLENDLYKLIPSIGYHIFDGKEVASVTKLQEVVDVKMYEHKIQKKLK